MFPKIIVREYRKGNQERITQRNWQHRVHKTKEHTQKNTTQYVLDTTAQMYINQARTKNVLHKRSQKPENAVYVPINIIDNKTMY